MPRYVVRPARGGARHARSARRSASARILLIGLAYKKNVSDIRESPSLKLMELLEERGARCDYHDPHVPIIPTDARVCRARGAPLGGARRATASADYDAVLVATDHDAVDYAAACRRTPG